MLDFEKCGPFQKIQLLVPFQGGYHDCSVETLSSYKYGLS